VATTGSTCTFMAYDPSGGLTDTWTGQAATNDPTNGPSCSNKTGGAHSHVHHYNNDAVDAALWGLPKRAYSAVVGKESDDTRPDSDWTWYSYFNTTATVSAAPNVGKLARIVRREGNGGQGGDGATTCGADRTGCTTYTYDGRSRAATLTDGNGKTTTYTYDDDDRVTQVLTELRARRRAAGQPRTRQGRVWPAPARTGYAVGTRVAAEAASPYERPGMPQDLNAVTGTPNSGLLPAIGWRHSPGRAWAIAV
jgi:YD repeat-containing protein